MVPAGFWKETRALRIGTGQGTRQTVGCNGHAPTNQTLPAPSAEASQNPMKPGVSVMSSLQCDGQDAMMRSRMPKSCRAAFNAGLDWSGSHCLSVHRAACTGPRSLRPAGMPMQACRSFPRSHSRSLRWARFCRRRVRSSVWMWSCLSGGNSMHRLMPSKIQLRISFHVSQRPSPWRSFLSATGSSSVPPVTDGGGKTEWMPCRMAHVRWRSCAGSVHCASWMKSSM